MRYQRVYTAGSECESVVIDTYAHSWCVESSYVGERCVCGWVTYVIVVVIGSKVLWYVVVEIIRSRQEHGDEDAGVS